MPLRCHSLLRRAASLRSYITARRARASSSVSVRFLLKADSSCSEVSCSGLTNSKEDSSSCLSSSSAVVGCLRYFLMISPHSADTGPDSESELELEPELAALLLSPLATAAPVAAEVE